MNYYHLSYIILTALFIIGTVLYFTSTYRFKDEITTADRQAKAKK